LLVVVGGHSRNIGKTSVMSSIIASNRDLHWHAIKITQHGHDVCASDGDDCGCAGDRLHPCALDEQLQPDGTDSGRYLAAGAIRSWWLRTAAGDLGEAMPAFRKLCESAENLIVESNSILRFVQPDLYIVVLDCAVDDMKDSARLYLDRADAFAVAHGEFATPSWNVPPRWFRNKPMFPVVPPNYDSAGLAEFVRLKRR
jgi:hypothetical protein